MLTREHHAAAGTSSLGGEPPSIGPTNILMGNAEPVTGTIRELAAKLSSKLFPHGGTGPHTHMSERAYATWSSAFGAYDGASAPSLTDLSARAVPSEGFPSERRLARDWPG